MLLAAALMPWLAGKWLLVSGLISLILAWRVPRHRRALFLLFPICLLWVVFRSVPPADDLSRFRPARPQSVRLRVQVRGDAREVEGFRGEAEIRVPVRATGMYSEGGWRNTTARIQLRIPAESAPDFLTGSHWEAAGVLKPRDASYVGLHRAQWHFEPDPGSVMELPGPPASGIIISFFAARAWLAERIALCAADSPESVPLLQTLLLGQRSELDENTLARFARTGIVHVFAISGLHMGLLAGMLFFCCRMLRVPYRFAGFVILPLLFLFTLCTGMRASALRACIMIACMLLAPVVYRRPQLKNGFALAIVVILGIAPGQVLDLGFQYSFLLVAALLAFGRRLGDAFLEWTAPDPWAPERVHTRLWRNRIAPRLEGALMVTVICFGVSAPLTAYTFNLISPIGLLGNLLAIPLVFWILATGFPAVGVLFLPVEVTTILFTPARLGAICLIEWVNGLESIPRGYSWVRAPEAWQLWLFYGCLAVWWRFPAHKRVSQALLLGLAGYVTVDVWQFANRTEVVVVDADRGQMAWLRAGHRGIVMVDTGSDWSGWEGARALKQRGVNRLHTLFLTHPDRHHVEGYRHIRDTHVPARIVVAAPDQDHALFRDLDPAASAVHRGAVLEAAGWRVEILHPEETAGRGRADDRSLVLRFSRGFHSILVMGGSGGAVEGDLLKASAPVSARVLVAGHPRSGERLTPPFLDRVRPEQVIFSGEGFGGQTPGRDSAESRVAGREIRMFRARSSSPFVLELN